MDELNSEFLLHRRSTGTLECAVVSFSWDFVWFLVGSCDVYRSSKARGSLTLTLVGVSPAGWISGSSCNSLLTVFLTVSLECVMTGLKLEKLGWWSPNRHEGCPVGLVVVKKLIWSLFMGWNFFIVIVFNAKYPLRFEQKLKQKSFEWSSILQVFVGSLTVINKLMMNETWLFRDRISHELFRSSFDLTVLWIFFCF